MRGKKGQKEADNPDSHHNKERHGAKRFPGEFEGSQSLVFILCPGKEKAQGSRYPDNQDKRQPNT
jgi:hypothetical protein